MALYCVRWQELVLRRVCDELPFVGFEMECVGVCEASSQRKPSLPAGFYFVRFDEFLLMLAGEEGFRAHRIWYHICIAGLPSNGTYPIWMFLDMHDCLEHAQRLIHAVFITNFHIYICTHAEDMKEHAVSMSAYVCL